MSLQTLQERLNALQNTTKQIEELIQRLATLKFQPGSIPLDDEDGNVSEELSIEIHQTLKEQAEDLELLDQEVLDLPSGRPGSDRERDKAELSSRVTRAGQDLISARKTFRKAQLIAKQNLDAAQRAERTLLLSTLADPSSSTESLSLLPRRHKPNISSSVELTKDEKIVNASSDITAALRRTHQLMASELSRSQFAHDTLRDSTAALAQLGETYSTLDTLLSSSRTLLGTLLKSQKSDTWYLETAFWVLVATIGWLVFRRFIYGPAWLFVWLPLKIFYKAWMGVFTAVGLRSSRHGVFTDDAAATASTMSRVGTTGLPGMPSSVVYGSGAETAGSAKARGSEMAGRGDDTMVEEVGKIIEDSQKAGGAYAQDSEADENTAVEETPQHAVPENRNVKKRMWEEPVEQQRRAKEKDEL